MKKKFEIVFLAKKREISQSDILIKQMSKNFELRIQELEKRLSVLVDEKIETVAKSQNQKLLQNENQLAEIHEVLAALTAKTASTKDELQTFKGSSSE